MHKRCFSRMTALHAHRFDGGIKVGSRFQHEANPEALSHHRLVASDIVQTIWLSGFRALVPEFWTQQASEVQKYTTSVVSEATKASETTQYTTQSEATNVHHAI